jgi:pimeloyl-ACP methyl ester carboxylesterase
VSSSVPHHIEAGGGGKAIVFLHGLGGNCHSFDAQLAYFAGRGWRAVSWDMPGYGKSTLGGEMTWESLAEAAIRLFDKLGLDSTVVLGHSMGGMVAQEIALRHPERVRGLILSATSDVFGSADGKFQEEFLAKRLAPLDAGKTPADFAPETVPAMFADHPDPQAIRAAIASNAAISSESYRAALNCLVTFNRRDELSKIGCPTLLLAGEKDTVMPAKGMRSMFKRLKHPVYRELLGVGHLGNLERPDAYNAKVSQFLFETRLAMG